jgi:CDP-paratose 2-epimerase
MKLLITGGAGFIGINSADYFLAQGHDVTILDNLSRKGSSENLEWIQNKYPQVNFVLANITKDQNVVDDAVVGMDAVIHLAAQVAVTTSVTDPRSDFEINALGTFNVLESMRLNNPRAHLVYASTNKVYGGMEEVKVTEETDKYVYQDYKNGIPETENLDFHSPYGCSKGAADQYVRDYARIYGMKSTVFRQSCIYGTRQFGIEDQGWVAWFTIASILDRSIKIYGNGKQVRDVLFVEDLVRAYEIAIKSPDKSAGKIFNIGGGPHNTLSLLQLLTLLERLNGKKIKFTFHDWRPGDQPVFICDIDKAKIELGWKPKVDYSNGVEKLFTWVQSNKEMLVKMF